MNSKQIEKLLDKYIQSGLSKQEEAELNALLSGNSEFREKFELMQLLRAGIVKENLSEIKKKLGEFENELQKQEEWKDYRDYGSAQFSKSHKLSKPTSEYLTSSNEKIIHKFKWYISAAAIFILAALIYAGYRSINKSEQELAEQPKVITPDTLIKNSDTLTGWEKRASLIYNQKVQLVTSGVILQKKLAITVIDASESESFGFASSAKFPSNIKIQYEPTFDGNEFYSIADDTLALLIKDSIGVSDFKVYNIVDDTQKHNGLYLLMRTKYYKISDEGDEASGSSGDATKRRGILIPVSNEEQAEIDRIIIENTNQ